MTSNALAVITKHPVVVSSPSSSTSGATSDSKVYDLRNYRIIPSTPRGEAQASVVGGPLAGLGLMARSRPVGLAQLAQLSQLDALGGLGGLAMTGADVATAVTTMQAAKTANLVVGMVKAQADVSNFAANAMAHCGK